MRTWRKGSGWAGWTRAHARVLGTLRKRAKSEDERQENEMTARERVMVVLERRPDTHSLRHRRHGLLQHPRDRLYKLRERMGLAVGPIHCGCLIQLIAETDADVMDALGVDVEALWFGSQADQALEHALRRRSDRARAVQRRRPARRLLRGPRSARRGSMLRAADAYYHDPVGTPLADVTSAAELDRYDALFDRWDYSSVYDEPLERLPGGPGDSTRPPTAPWSTLWRMHYLQTGMLMRGYERFLMDLMADKDLAHALLEKLHEVVSARIDTFMAAFGDVVRHRVPDRRPGHAEGRHDLAGACTAR